MTFRPYYVFHLDQSEAFPVPCNIHYWKDAFDALVAEVRRLDPIAQMEDYDHLLQLAELRHVKETAKSCLKDPSCIEFHERIRLEAHILVRQTSPPIHKPILTLEEHTVWMRTVQEAILHRRL